LAASLIEATVAPSVDTALNAGTMNEILPAGLRTFRPVFRLRRTPVTQESHATWSPVNRAIVQPVPSLRALPGTVGGSAVVSSETTGADDEFDSAYFSRLSGASTHWWVQGMHQVGRALLDREGGDADVLDLGCGTGAALDWLGLVRGQGSLHACDIA